MQAHQETGGLARNISPTSAKIRERVPRETCLPEGTVTVKARDKQKAISVVELQRFSHLMIKRTTASLPQRRQGPVIAVRLEILPTGRDGTKVRPGPTVKGGINHRHGTVHPVGRGVEVGERRKVLCCRRLRDFKNSYKAARRLRKHSGGC